MVAQSEPTSSEGPSLDERTAATLARAVRYLRAYKRDDIADLAHARFRDKSVSATVVVAGEVKRGKSSLVNALIGDRFASPVDVDVTTSATLHFVSASELHPAGTAELVFPGGVRRIPREHLADWVTVNGARVRDPGTEELPTRAIVPIEDIAVPDTVVVDTPGVGGLDTAHAQLAVQATQQACVLVIACDGSSPLTAPEMAFIEQTTRTVHSIAVVVTKTDKNLARWRPIAEEDRRLLLAHLGREVPVFGVSSLRALAARRLPPGAGRDAAEKASGITGLRTFITGQLAIRDQLTSINGLRTAGAGLRQVHDRIASDLAVLREGSAAVPDLTEKHDRLQRLKEQAGTWELTFSSELTFARQAAANDLTERLDDIQERWARRIDASPFAVLTKNPQVFTAQMEAELLAAMAGTLQQFLAGLSSIVTPLFDSEVVWHEVEAAVWKSLTPPDQISGQKVASKRHGLLDPSMLSMGMLGSSALGVLLGPAAGVVWIGVNLGYRALKNSKNNLLTWLRQTMSTTQRTTMQLLDGAVAASRPEIFTRYKEHLRTSMEDVKAQLVDAQQAARLDTEVRAKKEKGMANNMRVIGDCIGEVDELVTQLNAQSGLIQPVATR